MAFAGAFQVAPNFSDLSGAELLPSVGVGLRWMVAVDARVNLRVDYAWGSGSDALYVGVGEAF